jgi:hypothetical protein
MPDNAPMGNEKKKKKHGGRGCLIGLLVLAAILIATVFAAVRTENGRAFVEDRFQKWLEMDLRIGSAGLSLPCDVVARNVQSSGYSDPGKPGFKAQEIRVGYRPPKGLHVSVYKGSLNLVRLADGSWAPGYFSKMGELPKRNIAEISRITSTFREDVALEISEWRMTWSDTEGGQEAEASGITFRMTPVSVPGRQMFHYYLSVYNVQGGEGAKGHDIEREWLASDMHDYVELYRENRTLPASGEAFWEGKKRDQREESH